MRQKMTHYALSTQVLTLWLIVPGYTTQKTLKKLSKILSCSVDHYRDEWKSFHANDWPYLFKFKKTE